MPEIATPTHFAPSKPAVRPNFVDLLGRLSRVGDARVSGELCLRRATVPCRASHGVASLRVPQPMTCHYLLHIDRSGPRNIVRRADFRLPRPVILHHALRGWMAPRGLGRLARPLIDWSLSYALTGVSLRADGKTRLYGEVRVLRHFRSRFLSRKVEAAFAAKAGQRLHGWGHHRRLEGDRRAQVAAATKLVGPLIPKLVRTATLEWRAEGILEPNLDVSANRQCISFAGGPYRLAGGLTARMDRRGHARVRLGNLPGERLLDATAMRLDAHALAAARLRARADGRLRLQARGTGEIVAHGAQFQIRDCDAPIDCGIRIIAGDVRARPQVKAALRAPFTYSLDNTAYQMHGHSQMHASALFLRGGEPPPPVADESMSLDVQADLKFGLHNTPEQRPQLRADGEVEVAPEGSDPFRYRLSIEPGKTQFDAIESEDA